MANDEKIKQWAFTLHIAKDVNPMFALEANKSALVGRLLRLYYKVYKPFKKPVESPLMRLQAKMIARDIDREFGPRERAPDGALRIGRSRSHGLRQIDVEIRAKALDAEIHEKLSVGPKTIDYQEKNHHEQEVNQITAKVDDNTDKPEQS